MPKKLTLYHNSRCSKSRAAHAILEESNIPFDVIEYLTNPPSEALMDDLLQQLQMQPEEIVRKSEDEYETLNLAKSPPKSREEWIKILVAHPILIERPIVTDGKTVVVGRPPEKVSEWIKTLK